GSTLSLATRWSLNCCLFRKSNFVSRDKTNGIYKTIKILSTRKESSITPVVPEKIRRKKGSRTTCRLKFRGRIAVDNATFPFAKPVKIKYQSVQCVTISIIKPIYNAGLSPKKSNARSHAKTGVQTKLMRTEV